MKFIETSKGYINPSHIVRFSFAAAFDPGPQPVPENDPNYNFAYPRDTPETTPDRLLVIFATGDKENFEGADATTLYETLKSLNWQ